MRIEELDHTADIGVDLEAGSLEELYQSAAVALCDAITDVAAVRPAEARRVRVHAEDRELLLVEWLEELVYYFDTESLLFCRAEVEPAEPADGVELSAQLWGERFDPRRHPVKVTIKGITYHGLSVRREGAAWRARVIFDI